MAENLEALRVENLNLEALCNELVSGRTVVANSGATFCLTSSSARAIFSWYRSNQNKWASQNKEVDVKAISQAIRRIPPEVPRAGVSVPPPQKKYRITQLTAHRFAGIHSYGTVDEPPEDFTIRFTRPVTILFGKNGAGKSSIMSAITWCLTGCVYRSQRPPEAVTAVFPVSARSGNPEGAPDDITTCADMAPITPMPAAGVLTSLDGDRLPLDTWVELTLVDEENMAVRVKRSLTRNRGSGLSINIDNISHLQVSPRALEIGTRMPALIPYIQLGSQCDIGKAVAELTGLRALRDLVTHAQKSKAKLEGQLPNDCRQRIGNLDEGVRAALDQLRLIFSENESIAPDGSFPSPEDRGFRHALKKVEAHLNGRETEAFKQCQLILGTTFDPADQASRRDLAENVGPASGQLSMANIARLPSAQRLHSIATVTDELVLSTEQLIEAILAEARDIDDLSTRPEIANRLRLYARVAGWMSDAQAVIDLAACPVCGAELDGRSDPITRRPVGDHLRECAARPTPHLEQTLAAWESQAVARLRSSVPPALRAELDRDLPPSPAELMRSALGEELFESQFFARSLAPLKETIRQHLDDSLASLPTFTNPRPAELPARFAAGAGSLRTTLTRVLRALAFRVWRNASSAQVVQFLKTVVGHDSPRAVFASSNGSAIRRQPLTQLLWTLDDAVRASAPIRDALGKVMELRRHLTERRRTERELHLYGRAAAAISDLFGLESLVEGQVSAMMRELAEKMSNWKKKLYRAAYVNAPETADVDVDSSGALDISAVAAGTRGPAFHVSNSSDLRASLLAFLLAFFERVMNGGGIETLLLDDLHELFDPTNRSRVAKNVAEMAAHGLQVIVTSNDLWFARKIISSVRRTLGEEQADLLYVHPLSTVRQHIEIGPFLEEVEEKRLAFHRQQNDDTAAREYVSSLRMYAENALCDLLDGEEGLPNDPTLSDLLGAVRQRRNAGQEPFANAVFGTLVNDAALRAGTDFLELVNLSHHGRASEITYGVVDAVKDECERCQRLMIDVHEEYERWLRRDLRASAAARTIQRPAASILPAFSARMVGTLAAMSQGDAVRELRDEGDRLSSASLGPWACYSLNTHNLGFSAPIYSQVLAAIGGDPVENNSLVIAVHGERVYARRFTRHPDRQDMAILTSEAANPKHRAPAKILPMEDLLLYPIVGVLFGCAQPAHRLREEAILLQNAEAMGRTEIVYRVSGDSALPLALEGQMILAGASVEAAAMRSAEGDVLALATSDGEGYLKRVGKAVSGMPFLRVFEPVGGNGDSLLLKVGLSTDNDEMLAHVPLLSNARRVIGVLY